MKKILSLLIAFSLTFVFSVNAFATNVPKDKENISSENVYSQKLLLPVAVIPAIFMGMDISILICAKQIEQ